MFKTQYLSRVEGGAVAYTNGKGSRDRFYQVRIFFPDMD